MKFRIDQEPINEKTRMSAPHLLCSIGFALSLLAKTMTNIEDDQHPYTYTD